jgi:tRNA pseudouridine13 synthase
VSQSWPRATGDTVARGILKSAPEDFRVAEDLGFEPGGEGEHVFLHLEKRLLNTQDLAQRLSSLSGIHPRDISFSGMKDRQAVTRQWFSVRMAGKAEPDWRGLEVPGEVHVLAVTRHQRKLKRGVHRGNRFSIVLREMQGERGEIEARLQQLREGGAPNYFGEQRFGRDGATLQQARDWMAAGGRRISRNRRSLYLSALRSQLFNQVLADRVARHTWNSIEPGDTCILHGSRSLFNADEVSEDIRQRAVSGDLHPGLPLWGRGADSDGPFARVRQVLEPQADVCQFLESAGLELGWRPARLLPNDFCWQFCDDGSLQLDFRLSAGNYATALLAEFVQWADPATGQNKK